MRRRRTTGNALTTRESELVAFGKRRRHERSALDVTMSPTSRRHGKLEMARDENGVLVLLEDGRPTVWMSDEARVQLLAMEVGDPPRLNVERIQDA